MFTTSVGLIRKRAAALGLTLALIALAAVSFSKQSRAAISAARASAIHDCNVSAARFRTVPTWGNYELFTYRACMSEHNQVE
jgi:hypothetical protein